MSEVAQTSPRPSTLDSENQLQSTVTYVSTLLETNEQAKILSLQGEQAQVALDLLWKKGQDSMTKAATNNWRRNLLKLAATYHKLPQACMVTGVTNPDGDAKGSGGTTDIYLGLLNNNKTVALKRLRILLMFTGAPRIHLQQDFYHAALIWKTLSHPNVLPIYGLNENAFRNTPCIVMPWMENGSATRYLRKIEPLTENVHISLLHKWVPQIAEGLAYLHSQEVVHGALRGVNILVDDKENVQLTDFGLFGLSQLLQETYANMPPDSRWQAPETIDPEAYSMENGKPTMASDVHAFACTCIEIYTLRPPFHDAADLQVSTRIMKGERPPRPVSPAMSDELWSLITKCWLPKPVDRPSASEVAKQVRKIIGPVYSPSPRPSPRPSPPTTITSAPTRPAPSDKQLPNTPPSPPSKTSTGTPKLPKPTKPLPQKKETTSSQQTSSSRTSALEVLYFWKWFQRAYTKKQRA